MENQNSEININYVVQAFQDKVSQLISEIVVKEAMLRQLQDELQKFIKDVKE
jgi:hypothetical protein